MMRNTSESWGLPARALHWIVALGVLGLFCFGLWMKEVPPRGERHFYYALHATVGISILALMAVRLVWWLLNPTPAAPAGTPSWRHWASWASHRLLYALTFAVLIVGWLLSGTLRKPIELKAFGVIPVPQILEARSPYHRMLEDWHEMLAYALIALVALHAGAALYHHYVLRDGVLRRMLRRMPADKEGNAGARAPAE
jgi:cytochrome b561